MYLNINGKKIKVVIAKSFWNRLKGFIGKTNIDYCICFPRCNSVHTFFMKENIDIVMTDRNNKVLKIVINAPKNRLYECKEAYYTYELPRNTLTPDINEIKIED